MLIKHTTQLPADSCIDVGKPEIWNDNEVIEITLAAGTVLGNLGAVDASAGEITSSEVTAWIASDSGGGTTNFLRADGAWAAPASSGGGLTYLQTLSAVMLG